MERNLTHIFLFPVDACSTENIASMFFGDENIASIFFVAEKYAYLQYGTENIASKNFVDEKYAGIFFGAEIIATFYLPTKLLLKKFPTRLEQPKLQYDLIKFW